MNFSLFFVQLLEIGLYFFCESSFGTVASITFENGDGHYEILLSLRFGTIRFLLWLVIFFFQISKCQFSPNENLNFSYQVFVYVIEFQDSISFYGITRI